MRKTGNRFRKMDEKPLFPGTVMGGVIWRPLRPRSSKSYCLMVRQKSAVFSPHIVSKPFKACIFIVASWPVQFFTLRNDVVGGPIV